MLKEGKLGLILGVCLKNGIGFGPFHTQRVKILVHVCKDQGVDSAVSELRLDAHKKKFGTIVVLEEK